jgi:soluble lytic murein transglycosylase
MPQWRKTILKLSALNRPTKLAIVGGLLAAMVTVGVTIGRNFLPGESKPTVPLVDVLPGSLSSTAPLSPQKVKELTALANGNDAGRRNPARVQLAVDALSQRQPAAALKWLDGLEQNYSVLAAQIKVWRGQAQAQAGQPEAAIATWQAVVRDFADQPEAADALYGLGQLQAQRQADYWNQLIERFPQHPRAVEVAQARLKQSSQQPELLLLVAKHGLYVDNIKAVLTQLTSEYANQLTPADWEAIGFAYWEKLDYENAARAYARAPNTSLNQFRVARGWQLADNKVKATAAYQQFVQAYPNAPETPVAYLRLAKLTKDTPTALTYLDKVIQAANAQNLKERAAEALAEKIELASKTGNTSVAALSRQQLLGNYSPSEAAANLRWTTAQRQAKQNQWLAARKQALELVAANSNSPLAPRALFWAGRWANRLGQPKDQAQAFTQLWQRYPTSFYTWRAASLSNWSVGTFSSLQSFQPKIRPQQSQRLPATAGSAALKELHQIGLSRPAWERWQWEFRNRVKPNFDEQLTDGVLRLGVSDYLDGIFMLENLRVRAQQEPDLQPQFQTLQQQPGYWYALYPLPYLEPVQRWSGKNQLNSLLVLALMRQESRFQRKIRSVVGAVGLMQVMPETGAEIAKQIGVQQYSLENAEDNIRFGTWYLDHTHDLYQGNTIYALASYNAGPGNLDDWLKRFPTQDQDGFIESIPFDETQNYVKKVMENYWNYLRLYNPETIAHLRQYQP